METGRIIINIPCRESSNDTKSATCPQQRNVGGSGALVVEVGQAEEEECQIKREEEHEERDGRAKGADQQQEGEDEPAKEVDSKGVEERLG